MSDHTLADAGFSRELLEAGVGAWPWRVEDEAETGRALVRRREAERRAVRELDACSDAELADLGIARGDIARAVRDGRVGVETDATGRDDGDRLAA